MSLEQLRMERLQTEIESKRLTLAEEHTALKKLQSEIDSFAREVARDSLIVADLPNSDGWRVVRANFFTSIETDALLISYLTPHPALGPAELPFPLRFNNNTRLSRGLLYHSLEEIGFKKIEEIQWSDDWLPPYYNANYRPPRLQP